MRMVKAIDFPYNTGLVSEEAFQNHLLLYRGYVDKSNKILTELEHNPQAENANKNYSHYRSLKKELGYNMNGVILHEIFFRNIGSGGYRPKEHFLRLVNEHFGGFEEWKKDFIATGIAARGWCLACYEQRTGKMMNVLQDAYNKDFIVSAYPLLVLDVYEHGFTKDYGANQSEYVKNAVEYINWDAAESRAKVLGG